MADNRITDPARARKPARAICADLRLSREAPMKVLVQTGKAPPEPTEASEETRELFRSRAADGEVFERALEHLMLTGELAPDGPQGAVAVPAAAALRIARTRFDSPTRR